MKRNGFTLVELLVVVAVFSILALLATQSLALSLRGSRKSESIVNVREELSRTLSVMERQIRNASDIACTAPSLITYTDQYYNQNETFECVTTSSPYGHIASSSARLTSPNILVDCSATTFSCAGTDPESVVITLVAEDAQGAGVEGARVTIDTRVNLRVY
jgi:prepilin-type N-terminal cleavage/methylation domain-containing protein